jgi:hypothetical protein
LSNKIVISTYQFEGRLSGQLLGPDDIERTDLPISIRFENGDACVELHHPKGTSESLKVLIEDGVAHQLLNIIELYSR